MDCELLQRANLSVDLIKNHSKDKALHFTRQLLKKSFHLQTINVCLN